MQRFDMGKLYGRMRGFFYSGISVPGIQGSYNLQMGSCTGGPRARLVLDPVTLTSYKTRLGLAFKRKDSNNQGMM